MRINVGGVVLNKEGKIVMVSQQGRSWSLPKGGLDDGENMIEGARREIFEETGLKNLELLSENSLGQYERTKVYFRKEDEDLMDLRQMNIFLFRTNEMELHPQDPENPEARWVDREEVADLLTHPKDKEFFLSIKNMLPR